MGFPRTTLGGVLDGSHDAHGGDHSKLFRVEAVIGPVRDR